MACSKQMFFIIIQNIANVSSLKIISGFPHIPFHFSDRELPSSFQISQHSYILSGTSQMSRIFAWLKIRETSIIHCGDRTEVEQLRKTATNAILQQNLRSGFNSRRGSIFGSPPKLWATFPSPLPPSPRSHKYFCFSFAAYFLLCLSLVALCSSNLSVRPPPSTPPSTVIFVPPVLPYKSFQCFRACFHLSVPLFDRRVDKPFTYNSVFPKTSVSRGRRRVKWLRKDWRSRSILYFTPLPISVWFAFFSPASLAAGSFQVRSLVPKVLIFVHA